MKNTLIISLLLFGAALSPHLVIADTSTDAQDLAGIQEALNAGKQYSSKKPTKAGLEDAIKQTESDMDEYEKKYKDAQHEYDNYTKKAKNAHNSADKKKYSALADQAESTHKLFKTKYHEAEDDIKGFKDMLKHAK